MNSSSPAFSISLMLPFIPVMAALLVGLVLCLARRDRLGSAGPLAIAGFILALLVQGTGPMVSTLPVQLNTSGKSATEIGLIMSTVSLLRGCLSAAAFGFLTAAILRGRAGAPPEQAAGR